MPDLVEPTWPIPPEQGLIFLPHTFHYFFLSLVRPETLTGFSFFLPHEIKDLFPMYRKVVCSFDFEEGTTVLIPLQYIIL